MANIMRLSDRYVVKIDDVTFKVSPLSYYEKQELLSCVKLQGGKEVLDVGKANFYYIKKGLKEVSGITDYSGKEWKPEFDDSGVTDECISELLMLEETSSFMECAWKVLNGMNEESRKDARIVIDSKGN